MLFSQMRVLMFMTGLPVDEYGGHALHDYKSMLPPPCGFVNHVQHVALAYRSLPHDGASFECVAILHDPAVETQKGRGHGRAPSCHALIDALLLGDDVRHLTGDDAGALDACEHAVCAADQLAVDELLHHRPDQSVSKAGLRAVEFHCIGLAGCFGAEHEAKDGGLRISHVLPPYSTNVARLLRTMAAVCSVSRVMSCPAHAYATASVASGLTLAIVSPFVLTNVMRIVPAWSWTVICASCVLNFGYPLKL